RDWSSDVCSSDLDPRAEGERPGAGRLGMPGRVRLEVLELPGDAEPARRRLDPADRLVTGLLVVAPRACFAADRDRLDTLDDRVVRIHVAVEAADLAVGDDVDPRT